MSIHFGRPDSIQSISDAVLRYGDKEFESATRSTIPMLSLLNHDRNTFNKIVQDLGVPNRHDLFLEYTVSPPAGKGKASHTDVMIKSDMGSLAIEAKWTEPMYDPVEKWLKSVNESNGKKVLDGWLSMLGERLGKKLDRNDFNGVIYQMIHRAASATEAGDPSAAAYFLFKMPELNKGANTEQIHDELRKLWKLLGGPKTYPFYVVEIEIAPTDEYKCLEVISQRNQKSKDVISDAVITALQGEEPLFEFSAKPAVPIGV